MPPPRSTKPHCPADASIDAAIRSLEGNISLHAYEAIWTKHLGA